jgi:uncharacterized cupin superfamily protein
MANFLEPEWDAENDRPPFTWKRARLGRQAGAQKLGASLFELPPGGASFPLHAHMANEEMLLVLAGRPTLTTLDGERELGPGEVVACPAGRRGAHRLDNRSDQPARVLIVSTMIAPDINEFPRAGRSWARSYAPGSDPGDDDVELTGRTGETFDLFDVES